MNPGDQPAFPCTEAHGANNGVPGMTLRQYYAGLALQGLLASSVEAKLQEFAAGAVMSADALLEKLKSPAATGREKRLEWALHDLVTALDATPWSSCQAPKFWDQLYAARMLLNEGWRDVHPRTNDPTAPKT